MLVSLVLEAPLDAAVSCVLMSLSVEVRGSARKKGDSSGCLNTTIIFRLPSITWYCATPHMGAWYYQDRSREC